MTTAEQNFQLLQEISANRDFLLSAYEQNPALLKHAEPRIKQLFDKSWGQQERSSEQVSFAAQHGASLIELIMFIVIVSVALAGILLVMNTTTKGSADPLIRKQALAAAYSMLEEIELQDFNSAAGVTAAVTQANRAAAYHIIKDYQGFNTASVFALSDAAAATPVLPNYAVKVAVTNVALGAIPAASAVQIDVTVTSPSGEAITATAYRTAY